MNLRHLSLRRAAAAAAAVLAFAGAAQAQNTVLYNAATTTANPQVGAVHFLQTINLAQGAGTYSLASFQLGINFTAGTDPSLAGYGAVIQFYSGVNTSTTATSALAGALSLGGVNGTLGAPGGPGNFTYTFTLNTPINLAVPAGGTIGVEFLLTDSTFSTYSTDMNGRFTAAAPTVGTAPGFVWNDANLDNTFAGSEQTRFSQANANVRFSMTGSSPVPEPGTWALMVGGLGMLAVLRRRRAA